MTPKTAQPNFYKFFLGLAVGELRKNLKGVSVRKVQYASSDGIRNLKHDYDVVGREGFEPP